MWISIIIPMYNLENYIEECLNSIAKQMQKDVEVILIDDGSTDNTAQICKNFCEQYSNIKYFYQKNAGVSVARNNGLQRATRKVYMVC